MRTVLNDPPKPVTDWLERRHALGQDLFDEVWEGSYHVAPAPHPSHGDLDEQLSEILRPHAKAAGLRGSGPLNIGSPDDHRVPGRAYLRDRPRGLGAHRRGDRLPQRELRLRRLEH
jgi:hypothetical protein